MQVLAARHLPGLEPDQIGEAIDRKRREGGARQQPGGLGRERVGEAGAAHGERFERAHHARTREGIGRPGGRLRIGRRRCEHREDGDLGGSNHSVSR